jgi:hypothetical protein
VKAMIARALPLALVLLVLLLGQASAQQATVVDIAAPPPLQANQMMTPQGGDSGTQPFDVKRILTRFEFWLSLLILAFGSIVVCVEFALLRKKDFDGNDILKVFGVTLIVVGTLFLIAAGFGDKQIAPAMGLFGTLAGYLLGKAATTRKGEHDI